MAAMPTVKEVLGRAARPRPPGGFDIVGLGQNAVDYVVKLRSWPPRGGKLDAAGLQVHPGGQVATALVGASRLGLRTAYMGRVGDDEGGRLQLADLEREGVDTAGVLVLPDAPTQFGVVLVEPEGDRTILWGLDERMIPRPRDLDRDRVCSGRVLHLDITGNEAAITAARWAKESGMWVSIDIDRRTPGDDELLSLCDIVIAAEEIGALDAPIAGVTLGARGARLRWAGGRAVCSAFPTKAADTTGCGDVFRGALLAAALEDLEIGAALRFACAAAALKARESGRAAIPTRSEVAALVGRADERRPVQRKKTRSAARKRPARAKTAPRKRG